MTGWLFAIPLWLVIVIIASPVLFAAGAIALGMAAARGDRIAADALDRRDDMIGGLGQSWSGR